jgi:hypothetical protein
MTDLERLYEETRLVREENRRLRAELLRARDDLALAMREIAELKNRLPSSIQPAAIPSPELQR